MPNEITHEPEVVSPLPKEVAKYRADLSKEPGAANFLAGLVSILSQHEQIADDGLRGIVTFKAVVDEKLKKGIQTDEDYKSFLTLSNEAGSKAKNIGDRFTAAAATGFMFKFHRALTGLRNTACEPWEKYRKKLTDAAEKWYLESKRAKEEAERSLARDAEKQKLELAAKAEELFEQGRMREGEAILAQARVTVAPVLPEAVPKVDNTKVKEGYEATCHDIIALGQAIFADQSIALMWEAFNADGTVKWKKPLMTVDPKVLQEICDRMGKSMANWPGVTVKETVSLGAAKL